MGLLKKAPAFVVGLVAYFAVAHFFGGGGELKDFEVFESVRSVEFCLLGTVVFFYETIEELGLRKNLCNRLR